MSDEELIGELSAIAEECLEMAARLGDRRSAHGLKVLLDGQRDDSWPTERQRVANRLAASLGGRPPKDDGERLAAVQRIGKRGACAIVARTAREAAAAAYSTANARWRRISSSETAILSAARSTMIACNS